MNDFPQEIEVDYIPVDRCNDTRFMGQANDNYSNWWCPQVKDFTVAGPSVLRSKLIYFRLSYCNPALLAINFPNETCKSKEESDALLPLMTLVTGELTQYFESASFDSPIKYFITSHLIYFSTDTKVIFYKI